MTEAQPACDPTSAWAQIVAQHAARAGLAEEALPTNKAALFDALAAADITCVVVTFDGAGDSGQIESVEARRGEQTTELPSTVVEIATPVWDGSGLDRRTLPLQDAIEELAYTLLEETHDGWEINEGAWGEFTFDVAAQTITLDYNERRLESDFSQHEF